MNALGRIFLIEITLATADFNNAHLYHFIAFMK